jgi:N-acetylglucosamine kinase-like BadF-type ATPase
VAQTPAPAAVLAVDGGNSKTDLALIDREGRVIATSRAPGSSHQRVGIDGALAAIHEGIDLLRATAGLPSGAPIAELGVFCLAGLDLPVDQELLRTTLLGERLTDELHLYNDTFAVLWAGAPERWGIGVAAGTGLNCVGVAPDGRQIRFPALGVISGDWVAGGRWLGVRALGQAVRARDGRGRRTSLEEAVPAFYDLASPMAVAEAVYTGLIEERQLLRLAPTVFAEAAAGDAVARDLLDQMADEVVNYVRATIDQLDLREPGLPVVLGGGLFRSGDLAFTDRVHAGIRSLALDPDVRMLDAPPVLGSALRGLAELGVGVEAERRVAESLAYGDGPVPDPRHRAAL